MIRGGIPSTSTLFAAFLGTTLLLAGSANAVVIGDSGFNFRENRVNAPINFSEDDAIVFGLDIFDNATGSRPAGALVSARNSVTGEVFALNRFGSRRFSRAVGYTADRATGNWQINVQSDLGTDFFVLPAFGTGPGTGLIPGVNNLAINGDGNGAQRTFSWDLPANLATANDGNVDRLRIRVRDSNNALLLDQRLPAGTSLSDTQFTLPGNVVTHDGLYQAEVLVEGFNPLDRSRTMEFFRVEDVSTGGVQVAPTGQFSFRDLRGENSVNFGTGDLLTVGVNVSPSVAGNTFVDAVQNGTAFALTQAGDLPTEFASSFEYDAGLTGAWDINIYNGAEKNTVQSRAVGGVANLGFVTSFTLTPNELTPTLNWNLPADTSNIDRIAIGLFDDETNARIPLGASGGLFDGLGPTATSYTFNEGVLEAGKAYVARVILQDLDANGAPISRSMKFVNFTPFFGDTGNAPVQLPTVDGQGVFNFDFDVTEATPVIIDPFVAVGYEFHTGDGDPNFRSVTLPTIAGDDQFIIQLFDGTSTVQFDLASGVEFLFDDVPGISGGIDAFTILGIDPAVGLNPADVTAFATTLTFVADGRFTGTMTPITEFVQPSANVPEPGTAAVFFVGLAGLFIIRRRRIGSHRPMLRIPINGNI